MNLLHWEKCESPAFYHEGIISDTIHSFIHLFNYFSFSHEETNGCIRQSIGVLGGSWTQVGQVSRSCTHAVPILQRRQQPPKCSVLSRRRPLNRHQHTLHVPCRSQPSLRGRFNTTVLYTSDIPTAASDAEEEGGGRVL